MIKILVVFACVLALGLMPPGSSAQKADSGQETVKTASGVPKTEGEAKKLLDQAKNLWKEGKYPEAAEAAEAAERVKESKFKNQVNEAKKLLADIATTKAKSKAEQDKADAMVYLEIARRYLGDKQTKEALDYMNKATNLDPHILIKEKDLFIKMLKEKAQESDEKFRALLRAAASSLQTGDYDYAINKANEVLIGAADDTTKKDAANLLETALERKNAQIMSQQRFELAVARRLLEQKDFDKAAGKIQELIPKIKDDNLFNEAQTIWNEAQINILYKALLDILTYLKWPFYVGILCAILKGGGWLIKFFWTSKKLQFRELQDETTKLGADQIFVAALNQWKMRLDAAAPGFMRLETPRIASLLGTLPKDKLLPALEGLPTVGQVRLGDVAKFFRSIWNWFALCPPWLSATFHKDDTSNQIFAQVTLQRRQDRVALLTCWFDPTSTPSASPAAESKGNAEASPEVPEAEMVQAIKRGAHSLAYKILYLLAEEGATPDEAEAFDRLRCGMVRLNRYIDGGEFKDLEQSQEIFRKVRHKWPHLLQAYLYEGLATGLREDHDEAAVIFQFVKAQAQEEGDERLRQRAAYNEAWAHLQKNTYESVKHAIRLWEELISPFEPFEEWLLEKSPLRKGNEGAEMPLSLINWHPFKESPLKAKAYADKAYTIARLPLFWQQALAESPGSQTGDMGARCLHLLMTWQRQIQEITRTLEHLLEEIKSDFPHAAKMAQSRKRSFPEWERADCRRVLWAIHNVRGHFYLNCAMGILVDRHVPLLAGFEQQDFLRRAEKEFQQCELLLSPRADTKAAVGTLFLFLQDTAKAYKYLDEAIKLNRNYEYAFYRLAQTWEQRKNEDKVRTTLEEFKSSQRPPRIDDFIKLYEKYEILPYKLGEDEKGKEKKAFMKEVKETYGADC
jgi:hypothetical protein